MNNNVLLSTLLCLVVALLSGGSGWIVAVVGARDNVDGLQAENVM